MNDVHDSPVQKVIFIILMYVNWSLCLLEKSTKTFDLNAAS